MSSGRSNSQARGKVHLYAVVRYDQEAARAVWAFTVKEVLPTLEEAKAEVDRLNASSGGRAVYFWQTTRFYPNGRGVKSASTTGSVSSKENRPWIPRLAPPPPSREEVEQKLVDLIAERITPEDADAWAWRWVVADDPGIKDDNLWEAVSRLAGCALPSTDRPYLYGREDFEHWLAELRASAPGGP